MSKFFHPLMEENVSRDDLNKVVSFLQQDPIPKLTNGPMVAKFEEEWGDFLGTPYNTMVGSGSIANEISLLVLKYLYPEGGEICVPPLCWISDIAAILFAGFTPVFVDINPQTLAIDANDLKKKITNKTRGVLLVHILGLCGLTDDLLNIINEKNIKLIEDICEGPGATFKGKMLGSFGCMSNCSYYYAHNLCSMAEGGMVSSTDEEMFSLSRAGRSHGLIREIPNEDYRNKIANKYKDCNPEFIFCMTAHNGRSQEVNAIVASNGLLRLKKNNRIRANNLVYFLNGLDGNKYKKDFNVKGNASYALILALKNPDRNNWKKVEAALTKMGTEYRVGLSAGGNATRQPYLSQFGYNPLDYPVMESFHFTSCYLGNYPTLEFGKIDEILKVVNSLDV